MSSRKARSRYGCRRTGGATIEGLAKGTTRTRETDSLNIVACTILIALHRRKLAKKR